LTEINELLKLLENTANDTVDYEGKVVHFQGYSFVFRDRWLKSRQPYVTGLHSSKFSSAGFWRKIIKYSLENQDKIKSLSDLNLEDTKLDYLFGGSLKTLLPSLKFGGYETLFNVWMFVKTPEAYIFPASFYYGQSGTSLGGWRIDRAKKVFPPEFFSLINFSPFDFTSDELDAFVEALELSLKMVPIADYYGIFEGDHGYTLMGAKDNKPLFMELGGSYDKHKIKEYLRLAAEFGY